MANFDAPKRKISQSFEGHSSKITRPTHLSSEMISSQGKRRRLTSEILENESSTDSYSNSNILLSESEGSGSDSDFEEHSYSRSVTSLVDTSNVDLVRVFDKTNRPMNSRPRGRPKSNLSLKMSQWEKSCQENGKRRSKCTSKNAMNARLNRLKKKQYIENLENRNAKLESEKQSLKSMLGTKIKEVESLKRRTLYLESVIKNESEIASVLRCVRQHTGLEVTSSLLRPSTQHRNSPVPEDHTQAEKPSTNTHSGLETPQPTEEEAFAAAVLWRLALHTFCHPTSGSRQLKSSLPNYKSDSPRDTS
ncbi:uncharacterized protein LOC128986111 isoform X2 [Macrosteles quadrilineatus]|uniref:uncharacterized protein LOC128986111 isoform X2 n=1 Tax=Macrosteles quadrilineatus TaxID=74068 RepID=UPI0023E21B41|nr:uncharacterized protein LOC128986111 isoform X2 [Macrosteles quadrilineatus]